MKRPFGNAVALNEGATLTALNCTFTGNTLVQGRQTQGRGGSAIWVPNTGAAYVAGCTFSDNAPVEAGDVGVVGDSARRVFADGSLARVVDVLTGVASPPRPLAAAPASIAFLTGEEAFYTRHRPEAILGEADPPVVRPDGAVLVSVACTALACRSRLTRFPWLDDPCKRRLRDIASVRCRWCRRRPSRRLRAAPRCRRRAPRASQSRWRKPSVRPRVTRPAPRLCLVRRKAKRQTAVATAAAEASAAA